MVLSPHSDLYATLIRWRECYRSSLFDDVLPWWEAHSIDAEQGGYFTRLDRQGQPYSGDKDLWMIGREIWMFARLFNRHEPHARYRDIARHGARFALNHAFRDDGRMYFRLSPEGRPLADCLSLYTECFMAIALAELGVADGDDTLKQRAIAMYDRILPRLGLPSNTPMLGYPLHAEFHLHAHDMMRITVAWVFNELWPDARWQADVACSVDSILKRHWKPVYGGLLENVAPSGAAMVDLPEGRMIHPGHAVESAWMLMEVAQASGDQALLATAVSIVLMSVERGWDTHYGGIRYLTTCDGSPTHPLEADLKLWWPHCEALYATLLGWTLTRNDELYRWHVKIHDYTFSAFPDPGHGEWLGYLNRDGSPVFTAKANGWKGCFHLPRALLRCLQALDGDLNGTGLILTATARQGSSGTVWTRVAESQTSTPAADC